MAPRRRLLDLERDDVPFFYGAYHHNSYNVSVATHTLVFWPVFLVAALLLHLIAPFQHVAAVYAGLYFAYCFLLDRDARSSSARSPAAPSRPTTQCVTKAGYSIEQNS
ncbi:hypothetical protein BAE44_0014268 [Dichanthelium oligosanthes]|uniref:Uncharacterized protein n=1 Tax=Dichanthelium oligosanthes TaxID=888268 RepID=A0A1E5VHX1_9POAL|nr:hypothetical protein BAE44_0014268 [Dichanthelium oligosanthes]